MTGEEEVTRLDAPNQQVVRADGSAPWEEGTGGSAAEAQPTRTGAARPDLDEMTKEDLLDYAQELGVTPANKNMTKEELRAGVDAKLAEG
jgi:hypothetical protein